MNKLAEHNNGTALLFNRCDNKMFHDVIFKRAVAIKFLRKRIRFLKPDGTQAGSPNCGSVLIAFGKNNAEILQKNSLEGKFIRL